MIKPVKNNVLVRPIEAPKVSAGGIHLVNPEKDRKTATEAKVVAVGPGRLECGQLISPEILPGDTVVFDSRVGTDVQVDGEKLKIVNADHVFAVLEEG